MSNSRPRDGELEIGALLYPERGYWRPTRRSDCANIPRPCPYVSCRYNLYLDIDRHNNVTVPNQEPWDATTSCALDVAAEGPHDLRTVAALMHVSSERVRQIESSVLYKIRRRGSFKPHR